jgi:predicted O-methyltransferase YrrM
MNPILRLLDTNADGTLSADEINAAAAKLKELDTSQDGQLTMEELRDLMPFGGGRGPQGGFPPGGPGGPGRGPMARGGDQGMFEAAALPQDDGERKILAALEQAQQGQRFANVPPMDGRLLRLLTESVGAQRVVEIGTSTGESGIWFALALRKTGGHLFTHEIDPQRAQVAQENFKQAGVDGLITLILGDAHETVKQHTEPIDVLFLDADKEGYLDYLEKLGPLVRPGGLIIAHNMNPRQADANYVKAITTNPALETAFLYMEGSGIGVTMKKR